ncbi:MAG TPA: hypothetical protein VIU12_32670 [Chryseolinea sp.]
MKTLLLTTLIALVGISSERNTFIVKSQVKWKCNSSWKKIEKEEERQFDEKGNLIKWIQYISNTTICDDFKYDYLGNSITKEYRKDCSQNFNAAIVKNFKFGPGGRIEQEDTYENKKLTKSSKFKFRTNKDKFPFLRDDYFDGEDTPTSTTNLTYDKVGNLLEEEQLVSGSWFGTYTSKFNAKGQLIYQTSSVDGGVGLVEYFYIYENNVLSKDSVRIPEEETEYHVYDVKELKN